MDQIYIMNYLSYPMEVMFMSGGIKQECSRRYATLLRIYIFMLAFVAACAAVVLAIDGITAGFGAAAAVCAGLCIAAAAVPLCSGKISYTRKGGCLCIERGLLVRKTVIVSRSEVQCSEISRSLMERRLGICTLTLTTGGGNVRLKGIDYSDGQRLKFLFGGEAAD